MNKKCLFAVVIVLVSLICLSACGALRDTADKNKALNESLPYYELNAANYDEISYNGLTYTITDECLEMSELQEEIGQVSKRFKNVAGEDFSFGYVYSIVDVDISNSRYRATKKRPTLSCKAFFGAPSVGALRIQSDPLVGL